MGWQDAQPLLPTRKLIELLWNRPESGGGGFTRLWVLGNYYP